VSKEELYISEYCDNENTNNKNMKDKFYQKQKKISYNSSKLNEILRNTQTEFSRPISRDQDNNCFISSNNCNFNTINHLAKNLNSNNFGENSKRFISSNLNTVENSTSSFTLFKKNDIVDITKNNFVNHFSMDMNHKDKYGKNNFTNKNFYNFEIKENNLKNSEENNSNILKYYSNNNEKYLLNLTYEDLKNSKNKSTTKIASIIKNNDDIDHNFNKFESFNKTKDFDFPIFRSSINTKNKNSDKSIFGQVPFSVYDHNQKTYLKFNSLVNNNIPKLTNNLLNNFNDMDNLIDKNTKMNKISTYESQNETVESINSVNRNSEFNATKVINQNNENKSISKIITKTEGSNINNSFQTINKTKPKKIVI